MAYFKINDKDFSDIVKDMKITYSPIYNSQTNASGNTLIDMINKKRIIEVKFTPTDETSMASLLEQIKEFNVSVAYRDAITNTLSENVNCFIEKYTPNYLRIGNRVIYKDFSIKFKEL